ncbi:hypothetical protein EDD18DRAFT_1352486 [Armillaria luteobubalina]|uniref:C2H2-type domain-containing protein n=1 Tax=Armillaria luteobubalina TaxID=153913 RepID=A0AA39Q7B7_9AGAR|nr:hypothetical protein EDD18DRAFT_1352486 [Armillaria luteobubalina]
MPCVPSKKSKVISTPYCQGPKWQHNCLDADVILFLIQDRFPCLWPGCGKDYASKSGLSHHKRDHDPFATTHGCPFCDTEMNQKANLNTHIMNMHLAPYKCPVIGCQRAFNKPGGLECHVHRCNGPQDLSAIVPAPSVLQPIQLLPATNACMPLEGLGTFLASPQSDLDARSPRELISSPDSSPKSYIASELPASPTFYEHQVNHQRNISNAESLDKMEQGLQIYSNSFNPDVSNSVSFDTSFSVPSSRTSSDYSISPVSSSDFIEDNHISATLEWMLASYLPRGSALLMYCPQAIGVLDMTINVTSPPPIDYLSIGDFSFFSFETTDLPFSIDSGVLLPSLSSFEQPIFDFNFIQNVSIIDSFYFF